MNAKLLPNLLTISRIVLTPLIAYIALKGDGTSLFIASMLFTIAAVTDFYDGYLARRHNWPSALGRFLDPLADKVLVLTMYSLFAYMDFIPWWMVVVIAVRDLLITLLRTGCAHYGVPFETSRWGKWKTVAQFAGIYLLFSTHIVHAYSGQPLTTLHDVTLWFMYGVIACTIISGALYGKTFMRLIEHMLSD